MSLEHSVAFALKTKSTVDFPDDVTWIIQTYKISFPTTNILHNLSVKCLVDDFKMNVSGLAEMELIFPIAALTAVPGISS